MNPTDMGYEKVASKGPLTKYTKETDSGRKVVYELPNRAVRVNEGAREPNVVEATPGFFWRPDVKSGKVHQNVRAESAEKAHEMAQDRVEALIE